MKQKGIDQRGVTLVELLAVIIITSLIILIIFGVLINGQRAFNNQNNNNQELMNTAYILKIITKEIRKIENIEDVTVVNDKDANITFEIDENKYFWNSQEKTLSKNDRLIANNIDDFSVIKSDKGKISISIKSNSKIEKTEIYVREGE